MADMAWCIAGTGKKRFPVKRYSQIIKEAERSFDERSGRDIVNDIIRDLRRRRGAG